MATGSNGDRNDRGQVLVLMVGGLVAMILMVAVIVDGGNAWAQSRNSQNAADAGALAGATVMVQNLGGAPKTDADVSTAITTALTNNGTTLGGASCAPAPTVAYACYTSWTNTFIAVVGGAPGGTIPSSAAGVRVQSVRTFATFVSSIIGIDQLNATAGANAIAGTLTGICAEDAGCPVVPVSFSVNISDCNGNNAVQIGSSQWPLVSPETAAADRGIGRYEAIVPLCVEGPGGVGWLDLGCGGSLTDQIGNPCNQTFNIPTWLHTSTGNVNTPRLQEALNNYSNSVLLLPMFDGTCRTVPVSGLLGDCGNPGSGQNLYYHIPIFAGFLLDRAYITGNNSTVCNSPPGSPSGGGNGGTSCLKGWFVRFVAQGPVTQYNPATDQAAALGVQLTR